MSKKVYVGNMSYNTDESKLNELFAEFGEVVSVKVIEDQFTGRSKGFAFVEMATDDAALGAINALNGKEVDGREIKVNEAMDKAQRGGGGGNRGGFNRNRSNNKRY